MAKKKRKRTRSEKLADQRRTGRPPKARADKQSEQIMVRVTPAERAQLEKLANDEGVSLSALIMHPWRDKEES